MPIAPGETVYYRRARFTTRLPKRWLYTPFHYWLAEVSPGNFRIGITKFASRMLGDFVEFQFSVSPDDEVDVGQLIGTIEGFKAISDIYCAVRGRFAGVNENVRQQPELIDTDPYERGWIYRVEGQVPADILTVEGYVRLLDATIDKMLDQQKDEEAC